MWHRFAKAVGELQRTYGAAFDSYRPELHYMRGPGPKWHAKRAAVAISPPAAIELLPALPDIAGASA